jgi:hypothetical protein
MEASIHLEIYPDPGLPFLSYLISKVPVAKVAAPS